jgi:hypothetical protein
MKRKKSKAAPSAAPPKTDLILLVADKNTASALEGILSRPQSLGIRAIRFEIHVHPESDPGCLKRSTDLLRLFANTCERGLVIFDREGCGQENQVRDELETQVRTNLAKNGWDDRAEVIVVDPELETWVWSDSPHVATELGWQNQKGPMRTWLCEQGYLDDVGDIKPNRPKEAMEAILRKTKTPRSSAIYNSLAAKVSFDRCQDPAFQKLKSTLHSWFGIHRHT